MPKYGSYCLYQVLLRLYFRLLLSVLEPSVSVGLLRAIGPPYSYCLSYALYFRYSLYKISACTLCGIVLPVPASLVGLNPSFCFKWIAERKHFAFQKLFEHN
jgi:hypothetical protein